jgi:large subunit ribosomal protein L5
MAKATTSAAPRLKALYAEKYAKELQAELNLGNIHQVPKLEKIIVSVGTGKSKDDKRHLETVKNTLTKITGQAPVERLAKKSIAGFKIRAGMGAPVGVTVTLRGARMYEFLDRLVNVSLPRVRDFHGVKTKFDKGGNYNLGIIEQSIFAELSFEETQLLHGLQITFTIKNENAAHSRALLEKFGMPFEKEGGNR